MSMIECNIDNVYNSVCIYLDMYINRQFFFSVPSIRIFAWSLTRIQSFVCLLFQIA